MMSGASHRRMIGVFVLGLVLGFTLFKSRPTTQVVRGIEPVLIKETGQIFRARLDSGADFTSINAVDLHVINGLRNPLGNVGKTIEYTLATAKGAYVRRRSRIIRVREVRGADSRELRYYVYLTVVYNQRAHKILVNLNNRMRNREMMLLGRNWLIQGYMVDVSAGL